MTMILPSGASDVVETLAKLAAKANEIANENEESFQERFVPTLGSAKATEACWQDAVQQVVEAAYPLISPVGAISPKKVSHRWILLTILLRMADEFRAESRCVNALPG